MTVSAIVQALQSIAQAIQNPFSIFVTSFTNSDPVGGTFYYWKIGPVKFLCGVTGPKNVNANSTVNFAVNFPTFFSSILVAVCSPINMSVVAEQFSNVAGVGTGSVNGYVRNTTGTNGTSQMSFLVVGL